MQDRNFAAPGTLQLWFSTVSESTVAAEDNVIEMLSVSEQGRLNSIGSNTRRREYLLSRALIRYALSHRFLQEDSWWQVEERPQSVPVVSNLPDETHISLSHSKGCICFAIAGSPLGLDIEAADKKRDFVALAEVFMNDAEKVCLASKNSRQADYFYRVWSAKEARYKMLSPARQAVTSLNQICYSDLNADNTEEYLYEGRRGEFVVAAMMSTKPERISRHYFPVFARPD